MTSFLGVTHYVFGSPLPTRTFRTFGDAYSSISLSQSGQESKVGWLDTS